MKCLRNNCINKNIISIDRGGHCISVTVAAHMKRLRVELTVSMCNNKFYADSEKDIH